MLAYGEQMEPGAAVGGHEDLRRLYRAPSPRSLDKEIDPTTGQKFQAALEQSCSRSTWAMGGAL